VAVTGILDHSDLRPEIIATGHNFPKLFSGHI